MATRPPCLPQLLQRVLADTSLAECSDRQLLERFVERSDEAAFGAILDRHGPMLLGLCRRTLGPGHLADDVLQATFLVLARKAGSISRRDSLAGWLYGVAQRLIRQIQLSENARKRRERRAAEGRGEATKPEQGWDELLRVLDEELQRLTERDRAPLLLCYLEGRTQDEAAQQLGWSLSTLRRRLERGRELLKARMIRRGATLGAGLFAGFLAPAGATATLSAELHQTILSLAVNGAKGATVSASVLVLANGGVRMATLMKLSTWSVVVMVLGGLLTGAVHLMGRGTEADQPTPVVRPGTPSEQPAAVATDYFKDPLPEGAVARLGTMAMRHGRASASDGSLRFTADGKELVSTGGGWVRRWDLAKGHASVNLGDGWKSGVVDYDLLTTPDGKTATIYRTVLLPNGAETTWECTEIDLESGKERRTFRMELPRERAFHGLLRRYSPNGKLCAELGYASHAVTDRRGKSTQGIKWGAINLWNAADSAQLHQFRLPEGKFTTIVFTPDSKTLIAGDDEHTLHLFDTTTGKEVRSFGIANVKGVGMVAVSPDGQRLATVGNGDRFLRIWNFEKGTEERSIDYTDNGDVASLLFSPDSKTLIAGIDGGKRTARPVVRTWDAATGKPGRAWTEDVEIGLIDAVSPDGKTLATMNDNGVIRLWDMETGKEKQARAASPCSLTAVCFQPDGRTLLTVGHDLEVREWDAATGRMAGDPRFQAKGNSPQFCAGGTELLTKVTSPTKFYLQEVTTGKLLMTTTNGSHAVVSQDGKQLATSQERNLIQVYQVADVRIQHWWNTPTEQQPPGDEWARAAAIGSPVVRGFANDGKGLILQGNIVSQWDIETGKQKTSWALTRNKVVAPEPVNEGGEREEIEAVAVSPDGVKIAFAVLKYRAPEKGGPYVRYHRLMILETTTAKLLHQSDVEGDDLRQLAFSADGKRIASGGAWTIRVWEVGTEKPSYQFVGHRGRIQSLGFSPDQKRLASASEDSTVLVWDVEKSARP